MSKLAHSNDTTMKRIESDRLLAEDPTLFRCANCGLACPEDVKPCNCVTGVGFRTTKTKDGSRTETISLHDPVP